MTRSSPKHMRGSLCVHNARIWTADAALPRSSSMVIREGRIESIGSVAADVPAIDVGGRFCMPGFIDSHVHLTDGAEAASQLDLSAACDRASVERAVQSRHAELPDDQWLLARGWSSENWGGALPDKSWLAAAGERPVFATRMDIHAVLVNDAVLHMIDTSSDPDGGKIIRDAHGDPTGLLVEAAAWELVNPIVPKPSIQQRRAQLREAMHMMNGLGITAVGSMEYSKVVESVIAPIRDELTLRCRVTLLDRAWPMSFDFGRNFANDDILAVIGYKAFLDGTLGSRTARMLADYADDPGNRGLWVELAKDGTLRDWAKGVVEAGLSPAMHAIGDEAARLALDVIDSIGIESRPRIEHAQQLDPKDIPRFAGRIASMQPLHKADDARYVERRLGAQRLAGTFAFRALHDAGAMLAFGSDWPVVSPDPILGIRAAVTGRDFDGAPRLTNQNLTVEQALLACTRDAAFSLGMDDAGVLREGAHADFVLLNRDLFAIDWSNDNLSDLVHSIYVGGRQVFTMEAANAP